MKKLLLSKNKKILGVASGMAESTGHNVQTFRLLFFLGAFTITGLVFYMMMYQLMKANNEGN